MAANPYDPVTTTDTSHLAEDDWGLTLPSIKYKKYDGTSRFKSMCNYLRERPWSVVIICSLAVLSAVFIAIIIVVAVKHDDVKQNHPTGKEAPWTLNNPGLTFYPEPANKTILISFSPHKFSASEYIVKSLINVTAEYNLTHQMNEKIYASCNATYHPFNKTCRLPRSNFGDQCVKQRGFGYSDAMPCIFIQLDLPEDMTIKPITVHSPLWPSVKDQMKGASPSHVPVTCQGVTENDKKILSRPGNDGKAVQIFPEVGFPSYFYRTRDPKAHFIKPAVMVYLTSLLDKHMVQVRCTALGQLYDYLGHPLHHNLLATHFYVYMN